jgi:aspartyl-tRNA(Asn)/glutamyl-tRNA(Gln) amidotransferase subunit C
MSLTLDQVKHVARLSRLALSDEELARFTRDLGAILEYIDKINELDTEQVQPMAHALSEANVFRSDGVTGSLPREAALRNAPAQTDGCFRVPRIIEPQ